MRPNLPHPLTPPPAPTHNPTCSFKYPGRDDFGMKNMNIGIDMGSRVAIVGPNGAGEAGAEAGPARSQALIGSSHLFHPSPAPRFALLTLDPPLPAL